MKPDITAAIVPDASLGGLALRTPLKDIQDIIIAWGQPHKPSYNMFARFAARYHLEDSGIEILVDIRNGKIFRLTATPIYKGALFGKIRVGMIMSEAQRLEPRLYYDEAELLILCRGVKGLSIDVLEIDPDPKLIGNLPISAISVFAAEILTLDGQTGNW